MSLHVLPCHMREPSGFRVPNYGIYQVCSFNKTDSRRGCSLFARYKKKPMFARSRCIPKSKIKSFKTTTIPPPLYPPPQWHLRSTHQLSRQLITRHYIDYSSLSIIHNWSLAKSLSLAVTKSASLRVNKIDWVGDGCLNSVCEIKIQVRKFQHASRDPPRNRTRLEYSMCNGTGKE